MEGRTHRPVHDETRCAACSICVRLCPAVRYPGYRADPGTVRAAVFAAGGPPVVRDEIPPCRAACPLHQEVPDYVRPLAAGDPVAALEIIRRTNPLPAVCGAVCNRSCERACVRAGVDRAVRIRALKRAAVELASTGSPSARRPRSAVRRKVAIVGAGPAGLAAAHDLAAAGVAVTVLDELPQPGGLLVAGIPSFVLPRATLQGDIDTIRGLGVTFRTGVRVGRDVALSALRAEHDAVLVAVGAGRGRPAGLPGERSLQGVVDHLDFARSVALAGPKPLDGPVVVVGGTPAALECARIAVRLGGDPVTVAYARPLERWPADGEAIEDAREEGVRFEDRVRPCDLAGEAGRLTGVRFVRMRETEPDAWGHRAIEPDDAEPVVLPAATLVLAVDREPDLRLLGGLPGLARTPLGFLAVDPADGMTSLPGLFAAGDAVTGAKGVVEAVAAGRKAARGMLRWLETAPPRASSREAPARRRRRGRKGG